MKSSTRCVHLEANGDPYGAISPPIYQTATFRQESPSQFGEYDYSRTANPTRKLLEEQLAALEGALTRALSPAAWRQPQHSRERWKLATT